MLHPICIVHLSRLRYQWWQMVKKTKELRSSFNTKKYFRSLSSALPIYKYFTCKTSLEVLPYCAADNGWEILFPYGNMIQCNPYWMISLTSFFFSCHSNVSWTLFLMACFLRCRALPQWPSILIFNFHSVASSCIQILDPSLDFSYVIEIFAQIRREFHGLLLQMDLLIQMSI